MGQRPLFGRRAPFLNEVLSCPRISRRMSALVWYVSRIAGSTTAMPFTKFWMKDLSVTSDLAWRGSLTLSRRCTRALGRLFIFMARRLAGCCVGLEGGFPCGVRGTLGVGLGLG